MKTNRFLMIVLMFLVFGIGIFILTEIQNSTSVGLLELNNIVFNNVNKGIMFNVMSKQVDYERDDLFHLSVDKLKVLNGLCNI